MEIHENRNGERVLAKLLHNVDDRFGVKSESVHDFAVVRLEHLEAVPGEVEGTRVLGVLLLETNSIGRKFVSEQTRRGEAWTNW